MKARPCLLVVLLNSIISIVLSVNPACECVKYESGGKTEGIFTSPNYPSIYPPNINCILFTFAADLDEIIELSFLEFDLQASVSNKCSDFLRFFLDLERPEVNERHPWNYELCGNISTIQKKHYSSSRSLILEFHTDSAQANNSGFRGIFKFLDKSQFEMSGGNKRWGSQCVYDFYSNTNAKSGRFFSPRYPQNYPPSARCQYFFYAMRGERVQVSFQNIQLEVYTAASDCERSPDVIVVRDGTDVRSPVLVRFCNTHNSEQITSSGETLSIELQVDDKKQRQGFAATFHFVKEQYVSNSSKSTTSSPFLPPPASVLLRDRVYNVAYNVADEGRPNNNKVTGENNYKGPFIDDLPSPSPSSEDCVYAFNSISKKTGNFSSPNFPSPYFSNTHCRYIFQGQYPERVQLIINSLDLHFPDGDSTSETTECKDSDSLTVNTYIDGNPHYIAVYCGKKKPEKLMSSEQRMDVVFTSHSAISTASGFHATYKFVTDYGIDTGVQDFDLDCTFTFRSTATNTNGTFTSPNFPGIYPRNTVCNYIFHGKSDEKIYINFAYFDVEGIETSCTSETQSDYVEISNFHIGLTDRKISRLCGRDWRRDGRTFQSDNNFFRVTFKSNAVYDASGFSAFYQFRSSENNQDPKGWFSAEAAASWFSSSYYTLSALLVVNCVIRTTVLDL